MLKNVVLFLEKQFQTLDQLMKLMTFFIHKICLRTYNYVVGVFAITYVLCASVCYMFVNGKGICLRSCVLIS